MRFIKCGVISGVIIAIMAVNVQAAFMVETDVSGLANANYFGDGVPSSAAWPSPSRALGVTAPSAVFGGSGDKVYVFSYTPSPVGCLDVDNVTFAPGANLLDEVLEEWETGIASGFKGGAPGLYNVYATWRESTNLPQGKNANFTITNEGDDVYLPDVNQHGVTQGSDNWLLIAERIPLVTGRTYTVTQEAIDKVHYVSMRSHGVMWEFVEPIFPLADVIQAGGITSVEEGGDIDEYAVVMKEQPPEAIVITATVCEPNQITLNGQDSLELRFTPDDWNIEQVVTVVAVEDSAIEPDSSVWILHMTSLADANDADPNSMWADGYAGLAEVAIRDYDVPGARIAESDSTTAVSEDGSSSDDYTIKLLFPPTDNVTIKITTDGQTVVDTGTDAGDTAELVFGPGDWDQEKAVTVTAVDDEVLEGDHVSVIKHDVSSDDGGYDGLIVRNVDVAIADNECGAWGYTFMDFNRDCVVGLADLAQFAASWLECTQPYGEYCDDLR